MFTHLGSALFMEFFWSDFVSHAHLLLWLNIFQTLIRWHFLTYSANVSILIGIEYKQWSLRGKFVIIIALGAPWWYLSQY